MSKLKWIKVIENYILPVVLLLFPLLWMNQGVDVSDSMYSLTHFRFFPEFEGSWTIATFLANAVGWLLMKLPFAATLPGMNFYTRLFISAMALLGYYFLKGKMPARTAFAGEVAAICFCWCPTTILYNYLTYLLFLTGCILLYRGLIWDRKKYLLLAGAALGLNVTVRTPNAAEALMIAAVFYYGCMQRQKLKVMWQNTVCCGAGFAAGFAAVWCVISALYGSDAYIHTLFGLTGYSDSNAQYSPLSMVASIVSAFGQTLYWIIIIIVCVMAGWVMMRLLPVKWHKAGKALYILCIPLLIRLFWGRGMFTFEYYSYRSMYEWGMVLLYMVLASCMLCMADSRSFRRDKLLAFIVLLSVPVTSIGSNNATMPSLNNLFLAAPFAFWQIGLYFRRTYRRPESFPLRAMLAALLLILMVQGIGFRSRFAFGDGIHGETRDAEIENNVILKGMKTRSDNAMQLTELTSYMEQSALADQKLLTLGNVPGLHFIFDMEPALSHAWPDLETYAAAQLEEELAAMAGNEASGLPVVIIGEDWEEQPQILRKQEALQAFLQDRNYRLDYQNEGYQVYRPVY